MMSTTEYHQFVEKLAGVVKELSIQHGWFHMVSILPKLSWEQGEELTLSHLSPTRATNLQNMEEMEAIIISSLCLKDTDWLGYMVSMDTDFIS